MQGLMNSHPLKKKNPRTTQDVILEAMLDVADREIKILEEKSDYKTKRYTVSELNYSNGAWASNKGNF